MTTNLYSSGYISRMYPVSRSWCVATHRVGLAGASERKTHASRQTPPTHTGKEMTTELAAVSTEKRVLDGADSMTSQQRRSTFAMIEEEHLRDDQHRREHRQHCASGRVWLDVQALDVVFLVEPGGKFRTGNIARIGLAAVILPHLLHEPRRRHVESVAATDGDEQIVRHLARSGAVHRKVVAHGADLKPSESSKANST